MTTGRGFGRGRGRFQSRPTGSGGRWNNNKKSNKGQSSGTKESKKKSYLYHPNGVHNPNYHTYVETQDYIVAKLSGDVDWSEAALVVLSIQKLESQRPEEPTVPAKTEPVIGSDGKAIEGVLTYDEIKLAKWKTEHSAWNKAVTKFDQMYQTAAGVIFNKYCTEAMKTALQGLEDYAESVQRDPVVMMKKISLLFHQGSLKKHVVLSTVHWIQRAVNPRQTDDEDIDPYTKRVQDNLGQLYALIGTEFITKKIKETPEYKAADADQQKKLLALAVESFDTVVAVNGLQKGRYGNFQDIIESSYAMNGEDKYPKSMALLRQTLSNNNAFKPTEEYLQAKQRRQQGKSFTPKKDKPSFDPKKKIDGLPAAVHAQSKMKGEYCYCCGDPNHKLPNCPNKDKVPRDKWAINMLNDHKKSFFQCYHQHVQSSYLDGAAPAAAAPAPAPVPAPVPTTVYYQQPPMNSAMSLASQSHRSGLQSPPPHLQAPQAQHAQQQVNRGSQFVPPSIPQFHQQHTQLAVPAKVTGVSQQSSVPDAFAVAYGTRKQAVQHVQHEVSYTGVAGVPSEDEQETVCLDSGSGIRTWMSDRSSWNERPAEVPVDMGTNNGRSHLDTEVETPIGTSYKNPGGIQNINSLSQTIADCYRLNDGSYVLLDSRVANAFYHVLGDGTVVEYPVTEQGIYATSIPKDLLAQVQRYKQEAFQGVQTVHGNIEGFTRRQTERAMKARELYHSLHHPGVGNFKFMIRTGSIRGCPVTMEDVRNAELIFGKDLAALKGKTVRKRPPPYIGNVFTVPKQLRKPNKYLPATMDVFTVNGVRFLAFSDTKIHMRMSVYLPAKTTVVFYGAMDQITDFFNRFGFHIKKIECDREFKPMMDPVKNEMQLVLEHPAAQSHANTAERLIRSLKEACRSCCMGTPFEYFCLELTREMVPIVTTATTLVPSKQGVSRIYSPYQIITGRAVTYDSVKFCFATFGIAHHEPNEKGSMETRGIEVLYLGPDLENSTGGHYFLDLQTWQKISRQHFTPLPMPQRVIDLQNARAKKQKMPKLSFSDRKTKLEPILPAGLPAGVAGEQGNETVLEQTKGPEPEPEPQTQQKEPKQQSQPTRKQPSRRAKQHFTLETVEEEEDDDTVFSDAGEEPPDLVPWSSAYDSSSDEESDDEDDFPPQVHRYVETAVDGADPGTQPAVAAETMHLEAPSKAPTLPRVGWRRSQRIAAQKRSMTQRILPNVLKKPRVQRTMKHKVKTGLSSEDLADDDPNCAYDDCLYEPELAPVLAQLIMEVNKRSAESNFPEAVQHGQQHLLPKGLKLWGNDAVNAAKKEMTQLHDRGAFAPVSPEECTKSELSKAQVALMFVTEKRDGTIKARSVYNGKPTRVWQDRDEVKSPTVSLEGLMLTMCVDASENRDVMTLDVPNAFIQTAMPQPTDGSDRVIMKIEGTLAELLCEIDADTYQPHLVYEKGRPVLYVVVLRALYGMLIAALLWYKQFRKDLESIGFVFNPYDPCVANRIVEGKQQTVCFHVDDLKSTHVDPKVNDRFYAWCNEQYGKLGKVTVTRGPMHDYLGMRIDFSVPGQVSIDMIDYVTKVCEDFPIDLHQVREVPSAAPADLFTVGDTSPLNQERKETFHTFVAKLLFAAKRARPDLNTLISVLCTRVKEPNEDDWGKLVQGLRFLLQTLEDKLILRVDDIRLIRWWVDASFATHPDYRSHTGAMMSYGSGAPITISSKQKLNTRSSTDAELVGADDVMSPLLWARLFLEAQGIPIRDNILYQDNKSAIILEEKGKASSGKRTRALNIRYFFIHDQVNKGNLRVVYCPTKDMRADFFTKPLQGALFHEHRAFIMGHTPAETFSN